MDGGLWSSKKDIEVHTQVLPVIPQMDDRVGAKKVGPV